VTQAATTRSIVVERTLPYPPEKVWRALTRSELIAQWLMPNDFELEVGTRFNFRTRPMGDWDGVVDCEVLEAEPFVRLRYSWVGGGTSPSRLDSVVTWTLTPEAGGTRVRMEHAGFRAENELAFTMMSPGWNRIVERIADVIAAEEAGTSLPTQACAAEDSHG
jgi:uncharacterized protein YndB with AHSA1/START domain